MGQPQTERTEGGIIRELRREVKQLKADRDRIYRMLRERGIDPDSPESDKDTDESDKGDTP